MVAHLIHDYGANIPWIHVLSRGLATRGEYKNFRHMMCYYINYVIVVVCVCVVVVVPVVVVMAHVSLPCSSCPCPRSPAGGAT